MKDRVDEELRIISRKLDEFQSSSGPEAQGTSYFLRHTAFRNKANYQLEGQEDDTCNKDTGSVVKLRRWSRGIFAIVRGGGHIEMFAPLFNSESPTQVAMILLSFLCEILKDTEPHLWKKKFLRDAFQKLWLL